MNEMTKKKIREWKKKRYKEYAHIGSFAPTAFCFD